MLRVLLGSFLSFIGFLGAVFGFIEYVSKAAWGRDFLARIELEVVSFTHLLAGLRVSRAVPELREALWKWAGILLALMIAAALLHLPLLSLILMPTLVLFCFGALSLEVVTKARSVAKFQSLMIAIFAIGFTSLLYWGVEHDSGFRVRLTALVEQLGISNPTPTLAVVCAAFALTLVVIALSLVGGALFSTVGLGVVFVLWCAVKISAVMARHFSRKTLTYVAAAVGLASSVIGIATYLIG